MNNPVLLFDGVCNLCNAMVKFILNHEKNQSIQFAALQSPAAQRNLRTEISEKFYLESIIFIDNNIVYRNSEAVFRIAIYMKFPYSVLRIFRILPVWISDFFYRIVSKNRYSLFGKSNTCQIPDSKWIHRFLSE